MELERGSYHPETQPFPVAFTAIGDEAILVHATAWNRLDLSDPSCGRLRSGRDTEWRKEEPRPQHYRDYFHGRLLVSPGGRYLADDGPSILHLCQRDYYWDAPGRARIRSHHHHVASRELVEIRGDVMLRWAFSD